MVFLSDNHSSAPSTFLLHVLRSKGEFGGETDLLDGLEGSENTFFAYYGVGTADAAKEVRGQFADVQVTGHQVQSVGSR
jgi:hypothetical protein